MTIELVVDKITCHTAGIKSFILRDPHGAQLPAFKAGAHVNLHFMSSKDEAFSRSYSIVNGEHHRDHYELGILRVPDGTGGSARLHEILSVGERVQVSLPVDNFRLVDDTHSPVLIAGGIGVTPLLSMARTLEHRAQKYELHYFGRGEATVAFLDEIGALEHRTGGNHFGLDSAASRESLRKILASGAGSRHLYVCGPAGLMQAALEVANECGWNASTVHFEQFSAGVIGASNTGFKAVLLQSRLTVDVAPDETLLDALLKAGVDASFDCRSGVCGSCLAVVAQGAIDHRDSFLTEEDKKEGVLMCTCVSRAKGHSIELDL